MSTFQKKLLAILIAFALVGAIFVVVGNKINSYDDHVSCDKSTCLKMHATTYISADSERTIVYSCDSGNVAEVKFYATDAHLVPLNLLDFQSCMAMGGNASCDLTIMNTDDSAQYAIVTEKMQCVGNEPAPVTQTDYEAIYTCVNGTIFSTARRDWCRLDDTHVDNCNTVDYVALCNVP